MALFCTQCHTLADEGVAVCVSCGNGFTSQLACATCRQMVPRGTAYCARCSQPAWTVAPPPPDIERDRQAIMRRSQMPLPPPTGLTLPKLPGISLDRVEVSDSYQAGEFGATADVQMGGNDARILTDMNKAVVLLHALAQEMNGLCALSDSTRKVIRGCRTLASLLQEEVEVRVGRQR